MPGGQKEKRSTEIFPHTWDYIFSNQRGRFTSLELQIAVGPCCLNVAAKKPLCLSMGLNERTTSGVLSVYVSALSLSYRDLLIPGQGILEEKYISDFIIDSILPPILVFPQKLSVTIYFLAFI